MSNTNLVTAKSYRLEKENGGWLGQIVLTSDGMFASVTDYGNFSFKWGAIGDQSFPQFIISMQVDYFAGKILQGLYNVKRTKNLEESINLFAKMILPELKKVLSAEIEAEQKSTEIEEPVYLTVDTLHLFFENKDFNFGNIQLRIDENTILHYIELNNWEIDKDTHKAINQIFQFSFSFYGKHYDVYVREEKLKNDYGSIEMQGASDLFESFEEHMEDEQWPLLVALCKKFMELNPEDEED